MLLLQGVKMPTIEQDHSGESTVGAPGNGGRDRATAESDQRDALRVRVALFHQQVEGTAYILYHLGDPVEICRRLVVELLVFLRLSEGYEHIGAALAKI